MKPTKPQNKWRSNNNFLFFVIAYLVILTMFWFASWRTQLTWVGDPDWQSWKDLNTAILNYTLSLLGYHTDSYQFTNQVVHYVGFISFLLHFYLPFILSLLCLCLFFIAYYWSQPNNNTGKHIRGTKVFKGNEAIAYGRKKASAEIKKDVPGLLIHEYFRLPYSRETGGLLILGSPGSGKTQILWSMVDDLMKWDEEVKLFILDNKGDAVEKTHSATSILLAPWDDRSCCWNIAEDVVTELDAELLASSFIRLPDGDNAVFGHGARIVLTGILVCLQKTHGKKWGWTDLVNAIEWPVKTIIEQFEKYYPMGLKIIREDSKTSDSVLFNLVAEVAFIKHLAKAWPDDTRAFSLRRWIKDDSTYKKQLILQADKAFPLISDPLCTAVINLLAQLVLSPQLPDSKSRRIYFVLDEIAQIPRIEQLSNLCALGRSKGASVWLGVQDLDLLMKRYSKDEVNSLISMLSTKIVLRMGEGHGAEFASNLLGKREVERSDFDAKGKQINKRLETQQLVLPSELNGLPIANSSNGIQGWLSITGWQATLKLRWPIQNFPKIRQGIQIADWVFLQAQIEDIAPTKKRRLVKKQSESDAGESSCLA